MEAKGVFQPEDRQKHLWIREQYPHLDIRFVFMNPKLKINFKKDCKTTLADWADKHGFKWAAKRIPDTWFREEKKNTKGLIPKKKK